MDAEVIIVGAGPVGLTLAIDLGRKGISCILCERLDAPSGYPKMERCNPRTMEIFRRFGIAQKVRDAGYPTTWPMDNYLVLTMCKPELLRFPFATVAEARARIAATNNGTLPLEPYQIISQYTLEPLLRAVAETYPGVSVRYGHEFESFAQDAEGVTAVIRPTGRDPITLRAKYLVGCDGGASAVRRQLGYRMGGEGELLTMHQALFRCDTLWDNVTVPRGRHYHRLDPYWTFLIVQDSTRHFTVHSIVDDAEEMKLRFEQVVGRKLDYETLHIGKWVQRLLLSERYAEGRVFTAGDACHLVIPTGGLGMNTGVGDAIDLSWKLAATLRGWGGPNLLASYEMERRQVGGRNVAASGNGNAGRKVWRDLWVPWIEEESRRGEVAREHLLSVAAIEGRKSSDVVGAELGYRYDGSPIIATESGEPPPHVTERYMPTTWPGARLPHVWLGPGQPLHDQLGDEYTLLRLAADPQDAAPMRDAFAAIGAPFAVLDVRNDTARDVYEADYLLLRPDLHVVWRGNRLPDGARALAARATGH